MSTWIIVTIVMIWFGLPALLIVSACIHSSRLSRAEEAAQGLAVNLPAYRMEKAPSRAASHDAGVGSEPVRIPSMSEMV
jgi:hypothetical protein